MYNINTIKGVAMLAVIGGRDFKDYDLMCQALDRLEFKKVVSGGARGADLLAEKYCAEHKIDNIIYRPNWDINSAKPHDYERNVFIIHECTEVIAFWDGVSPGTKHGIELAKNQGKKITIIPYNIVC
jgi:hypothetical protein